MFICSWLLALDYKMYGFKTKIYKYMIFHADLLKIRFLNQKHMLRDFGA